MNKARVKLNPRDKSVMIDQTKKNWVEVEKILIWLQSK